MADPGGGRSGGTLPVEIRQVTGFCLDAFAALKKARATEADLVLWRQQIGRGLVQLWRVTGEADGWLLTRVDAAEGGPDELVLVGGAGRNARPVIRWAEHLAQAHGIQRLRTHVIRPGLARIYQAQGWHLAEYVMRKNSDGRQVEQQ